MGSSWHDCDASQLNLIDRVIAGFGPEDREQFAVIQYCDLKGIQVFHVPNSTWTKSVMQKTKNRLLGVRSGIPDLFVLLPNVGTVAIELKRAKKKGISGTVSTNQKVWIELLNRIPGTDAHVCHGAQEAIKVIESYLHDQPIQKTRTVDTEPF